MSGPAPQPRRSLRSPRGDAPASAPGTQGGAAPCLRLLLAFSLGALIAGCATTPAADREPANLWHLKQELNAYIDSGAYERGVAAVAQEAKAWVERRAAAPARGERLAIIFDLDETLLSNLAHMRARDFGYEPPVWDRWVADAAAPALPAVAEVYHAARARGVTVFHITGRSESGKAATEANLRALGLADHAALYCKPDSSRTTSQSFKAAIRKRLTEDGYRIIANVGDQESDLEGGYAERTFKLPNPFYITK